MDDNKEDTTKFTKEVKRRRDNGKKEAMKRWRTRAEILIIGDKETLSYYKNKQRALIRKEKASQASQGRRKEMQTAGRKKLRDTQDGKN